MRVATNDNIEEKSWIINLVRSFFALTATIQILHAICTYRSVKMEANMIYPGMEINFQIQHLTECSVNHAETMKC